MMAQIIFAIIFILLGLFFLCISGTGIVRLPDFYTRNHAIGKSETLGSMLVLCGLAIYNGLDINSFKLVIILLFIALANPTATHIVARAAFNSGLQPWVLSKDQTGETAKAEGDPSRPPQTIKDEKV
jgi:multicomponent Na+:H+ antiporter subunit G